MKVLVVGGTMFIGKHVVRALVKDGHSVTLLNRGQIDPHPGYPLIRADRSTDDLQSLPDLMQDWDAIVDLSAYFPKDVANLLKAVAGRFKRYIFCSTISVYEGLRSQETKQNFDESSPLLACTYEESIDPSFTTYGQRKAECERVALEVAGSAQTIILRPSVVYGAYDYTDRFAYWIWRAAKMAKFILPEGGATISTLTYAPDLAGAFVAALNSDVGLGEAYNIAESQPLTFAERLRIIGAHLKTEPMKAGVAVSADKLLSMGIKPWADLPLWLPKSDLMIDTSKSQRDLELVGTPAKKALADATDAFLAENHAPNAGLTEAAELELLRRL